MIYPIEYVRDVAYGSAGDEPLVLDIVRPVGTFTRPLPGIIQIHGGGWVTGEKEPDANRVLAENGFFTASINYRLSPQHVFPAHIHDCKAAVRWLRANAEEYGVDPDRIGVWGGSAGGHLASLLGTSADVRELEGDSGWPGISTRVQAVTSVCGAADLSYGWQDQLDYERRVLFGGPLDERPELVQTANPIRYIDGTEPPFLFIHGTDDEVVPFVHSQMLHDALLAHGDESTLVPAPGEHHSFTPGWQARIEDLRLDFFRRHLNPD